MCIDDFRFYINGVHLLVYKLITITLYLASALCKICYHTTYRLQKKCGEFDVFLTVHHSIDLFQVANLMHTSFIL